MAAEKSEDTGSDDGDDGEIEEVVVLGGGTVGGGVANGRAEDVCEEDDEGNVEYKLKLVNPPLARLEHLFTQVQRACACVRVGTVYNTR